MLNTGKMRDRFLIVKLNPVQGASNEVTNVEQPTRKIWGYLRGLSGRQIQIAGARTVTATATHMLTIRYAADIDIVTTRLQLISGPSPRTFAINWIDDVDNRHSEMHLTLTEVVG